MAIVSNDYYSNVYIGQPIATNDFDRYEARAQELVLFLVKLQEDDVTNLSEVLQTAIKKAICAQMEFFSEYGIGVATYGNTATGFTVGKVSVQNGGSAGLKATQTMIAPAVYVYLEQTGLLNPSVETLGEPWLDWRFFV